MRKDAISDQYAVNDGEYVHYSAVKLAIIPVMWDEENREKSGRGRASLFPVSR